MGATIRGHLPEIVARRVRSRLPPPPPSPPDARTPGSRGANSAFFFEFQVIAADLGRVPKKTRRGRGKAAASVQRIVSRTGFRGPGLGASADSGGRRFGLRNPERSTGSRCAYASRHPRYPGVIPCYPGYKTFDRAQGGSRQGPPFSRCIWGDFSNLGRSAGETRGGRGEAASGVRAIVSRVGFSGPGPGKSRDRTAHHVSPSTPTHCSLSRFPPR